MTSKPDDLEGVRKVVEALQPFDSAEQERIIRWAREKLGLGSAAQPPNPVLSQPPPAAAPLPASPIGQRRDLRAFVEAKAPTSDSQFAATVAYYYRFESDESARKDAINAEDLLEACRMAGRARLQNPGQTLRNAHRDGLLNRSDRGAFSINAVGENLVAMTLPAGGGAGTAASSRSTVKRGKPPARTARKVGPKKRTKRG